jgi:chromosome segregation ATPase
MTEVVRNDRLIVDEQTLSQRELHDQWKNELEQIVQTISGFFSSAFASINCVGEVQLREHENYDKWGIEILVKFRNTEKLQVLTSQRQSGGERSVSTMLYLISLQSLSKSPFRVVDEINQGMDPRNERLVHRLIVKAACAGNSSQYFLVTPKLLPDLEYHEKMKILCIYKGVWQPEKWDLNYKRKSWNSATPKRQRLIET